MTLHSIIIDNFFANGDAVREYALKQTYEGVISPFDGVHYPDISINLSDEIRKELYDKLEYITGGKIDKATAFCRLSTKGVEAPHQAHTDLVTGDWTALIYLNPTSPLGSGTTILRHENGMDINPTTEEEVAIWRRDTNDYNKWVVIGGAAMKFNRLFLVRSDAFHRAEPVEGFGDSLENGRLVMICFFKII